MSRLTGTMSLILAAALGAGSLSAADVSFVDFRLGGGVLSNTFKGKSTTTVTDNSTSLSTSTSTGEGGRDADNNWRGQAQVVYGNLGPIGGIILGAGVAMNHARFDNGNYDSTVSTPTVDVLIGYGIAVTPNWHFELTPFAGIGRAYYSIDNSNDSSTSKESDPYVEYGAKIGTYVTFDNHFQLGIEVPYLVGRYKAEYQHDSGTSTYSESDVRRNEGFGVVATLGARF